MRRLIAGCDRPRECDASVNPPSRAMLRKVSISSRVMQIPDRSYRLYALDRCCGQGHRGVMIDTIERALRFRALHERNDPFLLPNPWDAGTARLLAHLGFEALGTTSLGVANALGRRRAGRQDVLENCRTIAEATD